VDKIRRASRIEKIKMTNMRDIHQNEKQEIDSKKVKASGFGAFRGIGKFTKEDELNLEE